MKAIVLPGLDGSGLLGFLAGLGVLRGLVATSSGGSPSPRLGWTRAGTWTPVVTGVDSVGELVARVLADAHSSTVDDVLGFNYIKLEKGGAKTVRSLAAPLAVLRAALASRLVSGAPESADYLACLMCEGAVEEVPESKRLDGRHLDNAGITWDRQAPLDLAVSPTPFDFTSRNTQFLDQIKRIRERVTEDTATHELLRGEGTPAERVMRWDALVDMPGALFRGAQPMTHPVAEWLAFRGISFFPVVAEKGRARVAGMSGRRKAGELSWVLWSTPLPPDVITTVLHAEWGYAPIAERAGRGVVASFAVSLRKDATGYDGSVSPSQPLRPPTAASARIASFRPLPGLAGAKRP